MKLISSAQMKELDHMTIAECGIPGEWLMERAGLGVARAVEYLADLSGYSRLPVCIFAGRGNNGGDAFVVARYLKEWGADVRVWITGERSAVKGDAKAHLIRLMALGVNVEEFVVAEDFEMLEASGLDCGIVVDGVLGIGIKGPARGIAAAAIHCINLLGTNSPVVAIDLPSGLDADTGAASGDIVCADLTVTMAYPKTGLAMPVACDYVGSVDVVDIGIPDSFSDSIESPLDLVVASDLYEVCPVRPRGAHKGNFGHVLLIGGAPGYAGAIALATGAALRSGCGLVSVLTSSEVAPIVAGMVPEAMVHGVSNGEFMQKIASLPDFDAILAGPGLTTSYTTEKFISQLIAVEGVPLVLDADALNVFAGNGEVLSKSKRPLVITPHPGEAARLLGCTIADIQSDRLRYVHELSELTHSVTILKGAGTLIVDSNGEGSINLTGNPGMATGGSGDVLAGLLTGLVGQRINLFDASKLAVYLHGCAGDEAAWGSSQAGMKAGDIINAIPMAFRRVVTR